MRNHIDDPLQAWLQMAEAMRDGSRLTGELSPASRLRDAVDHLRSELTRPAKNKYVAFRFPYLFLGLAGVPIELLHETAELYLELVESKAGGKQQTEDEVLMTLGNAAAPELLPFWRKLLSLDRKKDSFAPRRRTLAYAALAHIYIRQKSPEALELLRTGLDAPNAEVRANAVQFFARTGVDAERKLAPEAEALARRVAVEDRDFEPRHLARMMLAQHGCDVPCAEGAVFAFEVTYLRNPNVRRTIEIQSEALLYDLHLAVLDSLGWDNDHLYAFFLNGRRSEARYCVPDPDEDRPADGLPLGALGFTKGHRFEYLFDFGDSHKFEIRVAELNVARVKGAKYPRVAKSEGKSPEQYPEW